MSWQAFWQGDWRWQYLVRYNGNPYWSTTWMGPYRLTDWSNPGSIQAVDCVLDTHFGQFAIQYKSFPPYRSVRDSDGNGGDLIGITSDGWIKIFATQDGGHPKALYYFIGDQTEPSGWVIAAPDLDRSWRSVITHIRQAYPGPDYPLGQLTPAYTRYILADILVPEAVNDRSIGFRLRSAIISEHYDTFDPTQATEMERFVYAQWMGLVRWEYYAGPENSLVPGTIERAGPDFPFGYPSSKPLNPDLVLRDCRSWTNWRDDLPYVGIDWPTTVIMP